MAEDLVRFGVAIEPTLLAQIDALAATRGCTRSELLRDLARAVVVRSAIQNRVPAVAAVTLVYNHHVRELSERLTSIQHDLGDRVRSAMHVHLDHENCLEVIVMRGRSDELRSAADRMLATRGVPSTSSPWGVAWFDLSARPMSKVVELMPSGAKISFCIASS